MTLHLHNMMCIYACVCIYNIWHMLYTAFWTGFGWRFYVLSSEHRPKVSSSLWRHENYPPSMSWRALGRSTARSASKFPTKIVWVTITATSKAFAGTLQVLRLKKLAASWHCPIIVKCQSESRLLWRSVCHETHVKESNSSTNHHASFVPFATKMPLSTRTFGSERTCGIEVVQSQRQAASFSSYKVSGVNIVQAFVVIRPQTSNNCDWIYSNHWSDKLIARDHFRTWCERMRRVAGRQNPDAGDGDSSDTFGWFRIPLGPEFLNLSG